MEVEKAFHVIARVIIESAECSSICSQHAEDKRFQVEPIRPEVVASDERSITPVHCCDRSPSLELDGTASFQLLLRGEQADEVGANDAGVRSSHKRLYRHEWDCGILVAGA
jgi:hypothetical protein